MDRERRQFLHRTGLLLSVTLAGDALQLSPRAARAAEIPFVVLSVAEAGTLEALAEALVPGAREAGIAQYLDKQLAATPADSMLMLKYLGVAPADFVGFYRGGLAAAAELARSRYDRAWPGLAAAEVEALLASIAAGAAAEWQGPPAPFFHFVLRSDACDIVYGTEAGFERIGMPYMAHIEPPAPW